MICLTWNAGGLLVVIQGEIGEAFGFGFGDADGFVNAEGKDGGGEEEADDGEDVGPGGVVEAFEKGAHFIGGYLFCESGLRGDDFLPALGSTSS